MLAASPRVVVETVPLKKPPDTTASTYHPAADCQVSVPANDWC